MAFIVRIAVVCLLLAVIPGIASADDSGDHDFGHDADAVSGADDASGDFPADSGDRDSGSAGSDYDAENSPDDSRSSVPDTPTAGSAGSPDTPGDEDGVGAREGTSSGSESVSPAVMGHRNEGTVTSGSSGNSDRAQESTGTSRETGDSGAASSEKEGSRPDLRDGSEHSDRPFLHESALSREDRISTDPQESDRDLREGAGNERRDSSPKTTVDDAHERKSVRDTRGMSGEIPDSGRVFTEITGTTSDDSWMPPGSSSDTSLTVPEPPGHRNNPGEREREGQQPAVPLPEDVPGSRAPFADTPALPASGMPLSTASGAVAASGTPVRVKSKDEQEPIWHPMDSSMALSPWMLLKLWCFLGFRRVLRKNVLESDERRSLYESIMQYPGVDLSRLTEMLRLNKETARYHLKMLAQNGKISGLIKQGIARYFPCRETISEFEKTVIHYLWIATTKRILLFLIESPGVTRQAIARELGIAGPSVTWQMQRLADDGLIEVRSEGRFVKYFLTPDSAGILGTVTIPDHRSGPAAA